MRIIGKALGYVLVFMVTFIIFALIPADISRANTKPTVLEGIYVDDISLGGKTAEEAFALVQEYVRELGQKQITLHSTDNHHVSITADEMGFGWANPQIIREAVALGQEGNVITRYKALKDLQHSNVIYELEYYFDSAMIADIIMEHGEELDEQPVDATMTRSGGEIVVSEGRAGYAVDIRSSIDIVMDYLDEEWQKDDADIYLEVLVTEPRGTYEELSQLTDVLATFKTSFSTSNYNRRTNIARATELIDGTLVYPGEEFATLPAITPFSGENGYLEAGSFSRGQLVDTIAGGICQVSSTLYNAALLTELDITERRPHSMMVSYLPPAFDAMITESANWDLRFENNLDMPIYIDAQTTSDGNIIFTIYGKEERPANRSIVFENEILEENIPQGETIYVNAAQPIGYTHIQSAYIGYKARLWKVIYIDGAETERIQMNSSSYNAVPRSLTVGTATHDPEAQAEINAAIATGSIDHIVHVVHVLTAPPPEEPPTEEGGWDPPPE